MGTDRRDPVMGDGDNNVRFRVGRSFSFHSIAIQALDRGWGREREQAGRCYAMYYYKRESDYNWCSCGGRSHS